MSALDRWKSGIVGWFDCSQTCSDADVVEDICATEAKLGPILPPTVPSASTRWQPTHHTLASSLPTAVSPPPCAAAGPASASANGRMMMAEACHMFVFPGAFSRTMRAAAAGVNPRLSACPPVTRGDDGDVTVRRVRGQTCSARELMDDLPY